MLSTFFEILLNDLQNAPVFYYIYWAFGLVYCLIIGFLTIGFIKNKKTEEIENPSIPITILVSSRNEEKDLPKCIESLKAINYPKDLLQIILVNDRSDDSTGNIINRAAKESKNILALNTSDFPDVGLEAKARGVNCGMKKAKGDWVFITDADAEVDPQWITHSLSQIDKDTGMVGGALEVKPLGILGMVERISWAFVQMFNLGMSGWGVPFICVGPNMAIRRDIYENYGGLESVDFTVAEDLALFTMVKESGKKIITFASKETKVLLSPVPSFKHLISQQRRWFGGGIEIGKDYLWILYLSFWSGFFINSFYLFGWLASPAIFLSIWVIRILTDIVFLTVQKRKLGLNTHLRYLPILAIYSLFIFMYLPLSFLFSRKIHWMGEGYSIDYE